MDRELDKARKERGEKRQAEEKEEARLEELHGKEKLVILRQVEAAKRQVVHERLLREQAFVDAKNSMVALRQSLSMIDPESDPKFEIPPLVLDRGLSANQSKTIFSLTVTDLQKLTAHDTCGCKGSSCAPGVAVCPKAKKTYAFEA
mmetsp:Transcript_29948/g.73713  ORF Transcript_29948/g.73713 Transcript_29948/m.73713 type:complete len:146 (-) Transcript_29948:549-986(-)